MEFVEKKEFIAIALNLDNKIFIVYIAFFASSNLYINFYPSCKICIALFIVNDTSTIVLSKYVNFTNVFSLNFTAKLLKHIKINNHLIKLIED